MHMPAAYMASCLRAEPYRAAYMPSRAAYVRASYVLSRLYSDEPAMCRSRLCAEPLMRRAAYMPDRLCTEPRMALSPLMS